MLRVPKQQRLRITPSELHSAAIDELEADRGLTRELTHFLTAQLGLRPSAGDVFEADPAPNRKQMLDRL